MACHRVEGQERIRAWHNPSAAQPAALALVCPSGGIGLEVTSAHHGRAHTPASPGWGRCSQWTQTNCSQEQHRRSVGKVGKGKEGRLAGLERCVEAMAVPHSSPASPPKSAPSRGGHLAAILVGVALGDVQDDGLGDNSDSIVVGLQGTREQL